MLAFLIVICAFLLTAKAIRPMPGYLKMSFDVAEVDPKSKTQDIIHRKDKPLSLEIDYQELVDSFELTKREFDNSITIHNNRTVMYYANISLGTPQQNFSVQLDTGSADFWIYGPNNPFCVQNSKTKRYLSSDLNFKLNKTINGTYPSITRTTMITPSYKSSVHTLSINSATVTGDMDCDSIKVFDPSKSSSYKDSQHDFHIEYLDNSFAQGSISEDILYFNDFKIDNFTFGLAEATNSTTTVFGIGLPGIESMGNYDNLPLRLVDSGYINRALYSLYLNDFDATSGSILFGAVDYSKFEGNLTSIPIISISKSAQDAPDSFYITSSSIDISYISNGSVVSSISTARHPMLLDSGTSFFLLPNGILDNIGQAFKGISYMSEVNSYVARCDVIENYNLDLNISGKIFSIPFTSFTKPITNLTSIEAISPVSSKLNQDKYCFVPFQSSGSNIMIAGDVILRYFYAVFDLEEYQIHLAPAKYDVTNTDIRVIDTNEMIPGAIGAPNYYDIYEGTSSNSNSTNGKDPTVTTNVPQGYKYLNDANQINFYNKWCSFMMWILLMIFC